MAGPHRLVQVTNVFIRRIFSARDNYDIKNGCEPLYGIIRNRKEETMCISRHAIYIFKVIKSNTANFQNCCIII